MPLQSRVDPFGELFADASRGLFMGNRGGRIHDAARRLGKRRWSSRQWICCRLFFNGRQRSVWGDGYTELFFLDEVSALAAGHRPCFECRRADATAFAECWRLAFRLDRAPRASAMDRVLHAERLAGPTVRWRSLEDLPDGASIALERDGGIAAFAARAGTLLRWTPSGYTERHAAAHAGGARVLTPPAIVAVLAAGYRPAWHPSAG